MSSLMGARDDRKVTPGITELSPPRVHIFVHDKGREQSEHIDGEACYIDVGSSYPGRAEKLLQKYLYAAKGGGVHPLKGIVSWVHNVARQLV